MYKSSILGHHLWKPPFEQQICEHFRGLNRVGVPCYPQGRRTSRFWSGGGLPKCQVKMIFYQRGKYLKASTVSKLLPHWREHFFIYIIPPSIYRMLAALMEGWSIYIHICPLITVVRKNRVPEQVWYVLMTMLYFVYRSRSLSWPPGQFVGWLGVPRLEETSSCLITAKCDTSDTPR